ncbi:MAG: M1 family peptidase [Nitrospinota bacterium]|nr:MAG: M1 family peptidase [Nitrospinota bacterium]
MRKQKGKGLVAAEMGETMIWFLLFLLVASTGYGAQIVHHDIEARIDPPQHSIAVTDVITIHIDAQQGKFDSFGFFLNRNLKLITVSSLDTPLHLEVEEEGEERSEEARYYRLVPREPIPPGLDRLRVRLVYRGMIYNPLRPPASDYAQSFAQTTGLIDARGTYLSGSTFWVPQRPGDLVTFTLRTLLPPGYTSVSQGKRTREEIKEGMVQTEWSCPFPQEEIFLIAGRYVVTKERYGDIDIMTFLYRPDPQIIATYVPATRRYLDLYTRLIGPYPYQKFALVENFWQTGFGMPSFTLLGDQVIRLPFIVHTSYGHEILHNWWGNSVYVDWEKGNWSEGLTTYGADYLYKERQGPEAAREYRRGLLRDYLNYVHQGKDFPLTAFRSRYSFASRAVGYGKAAMVFHMLRRLVGEEAFWASLQRFYRDFRFRVASWDDLFSSFSTVSGKDLRAFQRQWIDQAGAPFISLDTVRLRGKQKPYRLEVVIRQSPPYTVQVPVHIVTEEGTLIQEVVLRDSRNRFQFSLDQKPLRVQVDPDFAVFRRLHRAEIPPTLSQTLGAESVLIVVPTQGDPALLRAYQALVTQWEKRRKHRVIKENEFTPALAAHSSVWLLGQVEVRGFGRRMLQEQVILSPDALGIGGAMYDLRRHSFVLTVSHPQDPELTVNWLLTRDPRMVETMARKIVHYGKYSYLVFAGDRVIDKGVWPVLSSPMQREVSWE